jgi:nucleoredoxin
MSTAAIGTKTEPTIEDLLGSSLLTAIGKTSTTKSLLAGKQFLLLYFSASWCPPCKAFTPILKDFYQTHKKVLEIVYVSSDRQAQEFVDYFGQMPWTALESAEQRQVLARAMNITGIPALIVLDVATAKLITMDGRSDVMQNSSKKGSAVSKWQAAEPKPIAEGVGGGGGGILRQMIMKVLTNPIYIFGAIYIVKWIIRKVLSTVGGNNDVPAEPLKLAEDAPVSDDEF